MFGPNKTLSFSGEINSHHREPAFINVVQEIKTVFKQKFNISEDYEVIILTGSGTLAVESFVFSSLHQFKMQGIEGEFFERWNKLLNHYNKYNTNADKTFCIQLETSKSALNKIENPYFVDAVSAFPYYDIPENTKAWATVSSKILGAAPVLGILVFHKDILDEMINDDVFSYLNVKRMYNASQINQTHHTPAMALYIDFLERLKKFNREAVREQINRNSDLIVNAIGKENIIGESRCPVITVKPNVINRDLALKYNLYGSHVKGHLLQIFTYVESDEMYEKLAADLKRM